MTLQKYSPMPALDSTMKFQKLNPLNYIDLKFHKNIALTFLHYVYDYYACLFYNT